MLGAPDDDVTAAVARVSAALQHELFARARRAAAHGRCRRETPVVDRREDGRLVEGIVDLAFEEDGVWTIVDYKTDRELTPEAEAAYRRQVASYVLAISHATGAQATGVVLRV